MGSEPDLLQDYLRLGFTPPLADIDKIREELSNIRQRLIETLSSNPLTKNVVQIMQSTEVANTLVAVSQLGNFIAKTYFIVEATEDKIRITPTAIRVTDFIGLTNYLTITINEEKAIATVD